MAEENENIPNNVPDNGDILGSTNNYEKNVKSINTSLNEINDNIKKGNDLLYSIVSDNRFNNKNNFQSAASDAKNKSRYSSNVSNRSFKSSSKSSGGAFDDVFNGIEEALADYFGVKYLGDDLGKVTEDLKDKVINNLSQVMGVASEDVVKTVSKGITDTALKDFDKVHPQLAKSAKKLSNWYSSGFDNFNKEAAKAWNDAISSGMSADNAKMFSFENIFGDGPSDTTGTSSKSSYNTKKPVNSRKESEQLLKSAKYNNAVFTNAVFKSSSDEKDKILDKDELTLEDVTNTVSGGSEGSATSEALSNAKDELMDTAKDEMADAGKKALQSGDFKAIGQGLKGVAGSLTKLGPQMLATVAIGTLVDRLSDTVGKFIDRTGKAVDKIMSGADRWDETRWSAVEAEEARLAKDVETFIKQPFKILEDAANKVYEVWDSTLQTITATQGYDKSGLQDLMTAYAERLREEGLSDVVGTTDVTTMLQNILNAGLSGDVAEEFAYQATVLNKAIPTEDFTSYASTYASLASSYMSLGYSQQEALEYANKQLQIFASNVLTASREVSGGFTSSLTGVSDLFDNIVKIAQTGGSTDTTNISSALSIVQAIAGQVSPDVGTSLVNQIVQAAIGGNDSNLVALRSLAGTGASNTSFLQSFVRDPNSVLANLFSGLSDMFDKSTDNYMEVAYSLSDTFGISADALTRVDWDKLVDELRTNSASNAALNQNMTLLASGETTTSAESQRLSQINEYMIEQGLSYVLDNETARIIQEHMWDQEIAQQMQESTYAVDFAGGALELMNSIASLLQGVVRVLTLGLVDVGSVVQSGKEYVGLTSDIKSMIEEGKVGDGNSDALKNLTTYNVNSLTKPPNLMDYWGLNSSYFGTSAAANNISSSLSSSGSMPDSKYSWASAGKSSLDTFTSYSGATYTPEGISSQSATETISNQTAGKLEQWMNSMETYIDNKMSFDDWYVSSNEYGFSDIDSTLSEMGYTRSDMQREYSNRATDKAVEQEVENRQLEIMFYTSAVEFLQTTHPEEVTNWNNLFTTTMYDWSITFTEQMSNWTTLYTDTVAAYVEHQDAMYSDWKKLFTEISIETHEKLQYANNQFDNSFINDFLYEWKDYYIGNHTHYREATNYEASLRTINKEKSQTGEAILALAETLTKNYSDLADPTVQTNVLLGQIVMLLQSIYTKQSAGNSLTLPTALSALGLNIANAKDSK